MYKYKYILPNKYKYILLLVFPLISTCCFCIQVNADVVNYVRLSNGDIVKFSGSTDSVGQNISTKAVGQDERRDITYHYKYPEGAVGPIQRQ